MQSCCVILFQQFPKFIMWQLIVLENKRLKQWGIIKGELCALPLDREDAGPLQPASMKGKEFPIERWGIPVLFQQGSVFRPIRCIQTP
ncbi:MAG: hypothetical protein A3F10_05230 [Coxiella sp. RIFCSPHIGHO2_12_FULL_42_15]|nr:MAG: hypothetical protein A3F10_05230 [Coxiella sp. RIFCSPHIGHO2_12_FULL_42_15]